MSLAVNNVTNKYIFIQQYTHIKYSLLNKYDHYCFTFYYGVIFSRRMKKVTIYLFTVYIILMCRE